MNCLKRLNSWHKKPTPCTLYWSRTKKVVKMTNTSKELIEQNRDKENSSATVKLSTYSSILSYMGFSGYPNPFTLEAHINGDMPKMSMPITIVHEMAHQNGIAAENDANFKGFLNCYTHLLILISAMQQSFSLTKNVSDHLPVYDLRLLEN